MNVTQKFSMKLDRFEGWIIVEVSRSPNMNGFLMSSKCYIPEDALFMEHSYTKPAKLTEEEKIIVLDKAAELWDSYWTPGCYDRDTAVEWRKWSKK
jgi:hypothetical protein